ncbi:MAG: hypothetical protein IJ397_07475 [Lachnospiraceae bacterium]|nr:hypothetical protein [Lachnospiraceae bacterium]
MNQFNLLMTRSMSDEEALLFVGIFLLAFVVIMGSAIISMLVTYVASAIPYFIMARKAGFRHAWLAFIPFGQQYIAMTLSHREFSIFNKFKTKNRKKAFWAYIIVMVVTLIVDLVMEICDYGSQALQVAAENADYSGAYASGGGALALMLLLLAVMLVGLVVYLAATVVLYFIKWRMYYDVLITYGMQEHAMWASILTLFIPIVMIIFSYIIMSKEPDYGFGNYYVTENPIWES